MKTQVLRCWFLFFKWCGLCRKDPSQTGDPTLDPRISSPVSHPKFCRMAHQPSHPAWAAWMIKVLKTNSIVYQHIDVVLSFLERLDSVKENMSSAPVLINELLVCTGLPYGRRPKLCPEHIHAMGMDYQGETDIVINLCNRSNSVYPINECDTAKHTKNINDSDYCNSTENSFQNDIRTHTPFHLYSLGPHTLVLPSILYTGESLYQDWALQNLQYSNLINTQRLIEQSKSTKPFPHQKDHVACHTRYPNKYSIGQQGKIMPL